jgi:cytochrome c oxidase cbb3-type subunit I/II
VPDLQEQAAQIANALSENNIDVSPGKEIVALIAYLQRMGTDIRAEAAQ